MASARTPADVSALVEGMSAAPRFRWMKPYADSTVAAALAIFDVVGGRGRAVDALRAATEEEINVALQAVSMTGGSRGGVTASLPGAEKMPNQGSRAAFFLPDLAKSRVLFSSSFMEISGNVTDLRQ